jgi:hypothetical protein
LESHEKRVVLADRPAPTFPKDSAKDTRPFVDTPERAMLLFRKSKGNFEKRQIMR